METMVNRFVGYQRKSIVLNDPKQLLEISASSQGKY